MDKSTQKMFQRPDISMKNKKQEINFDEIEMLAEDNNFNKLAVNEMIHFKTYTIQTITNKASKVLS